MIWPRNEFTRFEVARLVGARSLQIALGAPILVKIEKSSSTAPIDVSKEEFRQRIIPITVKRTLPDETKMSVDAKVAIKNWMDMHAGEI